ncbi:MAG: MATE family efflux transporter [Acholeplasmataceae bacterium]
MQTIKPKNDLTEGSILAHIKRISIPASIGFLFNTLFNVVDTFYAGQISKEALAGLSLSFPVFFIIIALSSGLGSGTTALASIALGKKDKKEFHMLALNALLLALIAGFLVMFFAPLVTEPLFRFQGAVDEPLALGISYTNTIFLGGIFFILNFTINGLLNAQGDTKSFRNFLIIGFFLNLILDPLFIFGWFGLPQLGVMGIALATIIVQLIGTIYLTYRLLTSEVFEKALFKASKFSFTIIQAILKQGIPASLNMATIALGVFVINYFVVLYGGSDAVAGFGAALRIEQLALLPALGLNVAALTIAGQNYGAKQLDRIYEVRRLTTIIGLSIMTVGIIVIYPLARILVGVFTDAPNVIFEGVRYLRIEVFAFYTYVILNINISLLQGIKRPNFAMIIGVFRQILPAGIFYLLGTTLGMGVIGVWWGIVIINWLAVIITYFFTSYQLRQLPKTDFKGDIKPDPIINLK